MVTISVLTINAGIVILLTIVPIGLPNEQFEVYVIFSGVVAVSTWYFL